MRPAYIATAAALIVLAAACSSKPTTAPVSSAQQHVRKFPERPDLTPLIEGARSADGLEAILGTSDLGVGSNRFGFVLTSANGFVTAPTATVALFFLPEGGSARESRETKTAVYRAWPFGSRGMYITPLLFDLPGRWAVEIGVESADGSVRTTKLEFDVMESPWAPRVSAPAIKSRTKTVRDVERLSQLTTGSLHDRDLYEVTLAEAVSSDLPVVVVFASPAFCTNAVCGPQVEVLQELKNRYRGQAQFVHVDFYDNPEEIQGDLTKAVISPAVFEWTLPSIEWTFIIDREGRVTARFEAFSTFAEVEEALMKVL